MFRATLGRVILIPSGFREALNGSVGTAMNLQQQFL
jgi:hypothetical protein